MQKNDGSTRSLILAAGRGSRMDSMTENTPKCLLRLAGRTLLDWQLDALQTAGIREVAIVRGFCGHQVERAGLTYFENRDWASSNIVYSLCCANAWLRSAPCIVSYSDIVYHPEILSELQGSPGAINVTYDLLWQSLWQERFDRPEQDAESFRVQGGLVAEIGRKHPVLESVQGQFMGLLKLTPEGWSRTEKYLSGLDEVSLRGMDGTTLLQALLQSGLEIHAVPVHGRWCEVDHPCDIELYEAKTGAAEKWTHDWRT